MLSYNTHDKAEDIIQEYSLHILPIIIKYLDAFGLKKTFYVPVWL